MTEEDDQPELDASDITYDEARSNDGKISLDDFIRDNRVLIDAAIDNRRGRAGIGDTVGTYDDKERRLWLLKDEALYRWALRQGVRL